MPCRYCVHCRKAEDSDAARRRDAVLRAIANCPDCDDYGRLDDLTDCPRHTNLRRLQAETEQAPR